MLRNNSTNVSTPYDCSDIFLLNSTLEEKSMVKKICIVNLATLLLIAIWKGNLHEVRRYAEKDRSIVNELQDIVGYTPFHFSIHLGKSKIAEVLFKKYDGDLTSVGTYRSESKFYNEVRAAETALDQRMNFLFDEYKDKMTEQIEKIIQDYEKIPSIERFIRCMYRNEIEAALKHFECADCDSMKSFLWKNGSGNSLRDFYTTINTNTLRYS